MKSFCTKDVLAAIFCGVFFGGLFGFWSVSPKWWSVLFGSTAITLVWLFVVVPLSRKATERRRQKVA